MTTTLRVNSSNPQSFFLVRLHHTEGAWTGHEPSPEQSHSVVPSINPRLSQGGARTLASGLRACVTTSSVFEETKVGSEAEERAWAPPHTQSAEQPGVGSMRSLRDSSGIHRNAENRRRLNRKCNVKREIRGGKKNIRLRSEINKQADSVLSMEPI